MCCDDNEDQEHNEQYQNEVQTTQNNNGEINQVSTRVEHISKSKPCPTTTNTPPQQQQEPQIKNKTPKDTHQEKNANTNDQQVVSFYHNKQQPIEISKEFSP